jgi:hypothetical protein
MSKDAIPKAWHPSGGLASFVLGIARRAEIGRGLDAQHVVWDGTMDVGPGMND